MKVWAYARVSREERGQDVAAQVRQLQAAGHEVVGASTDELSGTVPPGERPGFQEALAAIEEGRAEAILIRDPERFSRQEPVTAMMEWQALQRSRVRFICLEEPAFTTTDGLLPEQEDPVKRLVRFIRFWSGWSYLVASEKGTARTMADFREGRRVPKAPIGRPKVELDPKGLAAARKHLESPGGTMRGAHRVYLETVTAGLVDLEAIEKRKVSRHTVAQALGWSETGNNSNRSKTGVGQEGVTPGANRPLDDQTGPAAPGAPDAGVGA